MKRLLIGLKKGMSDFEELYSATHYLKRAGLRRLLRLDDKST